MGLLPISGAVVRVHMLWPSLLVLTDLFSLL